MAIADTVAKPKRIPREFAPPPAGDVPLTRIDRDDGSATGSAGAAALSSGLEGTNYIIIELGDAPDGGSTADEILFRVGPSFVIHLLGGSQYFVPGATLQYGLPGSNPSAYKHVKADAWDTLRLQFKSQDAIQIARVVLVKKHDRLFTRADVDANKYTVRPGDYMSINDGGHSVLFREWIGGLPAPGKIDPEKRFATIEGNVGNQVRLQTRKWKDVEAAGNAQ